MADYQAIADTGRTLVQLFEEQLVPVLDLQPKSVGLSAPSEAGNLSLSLFLYQVEENGINRQSYHHSQGAGNSQSSPPVALDLSYIMTAHSTAEPPQRALDEQRILGRAIQILHDNPILRNSRLQGTLLEHGEELRIHFVQPLPLQTLAVLFPNMPYKLSFTFSVTPVYIDSNRNQTVSRVLQGHTQFR